MIAGFHEAMRGGRVGQWKRTVDDGTDGPALEKWPDLAAQRVGDEALLGHRTRPQSRTGDRQRSSEHAAQIHERHRLSLHEPNRDEATILGEDLEIARDIRPADDVEDEVDALIPGEARDRRNEIVAPVVDRVVRPERLARPALLVG